MKFDFPYGKDFLSLELDEKRVSGVLKSNLHSYKSDKTEKEIVEESLSSPIGSERLSVLSKGKENVVLICSDHTRPVPSKIIIPLMLKEIREGNPKAKITLLISTGCHRESTREELINKFGEDIVKNEKIVVHKCGESEVSFLGTLPSGGPLYINKLVCDADLVCSEGFIEPHFFAGFSGSRKAILPGVASRETVLSNHSSEFIADKHSRTGNLEGNLIHRDMVWAARKAKLLFICNVVINSQKEIVYCVSGDMEKAHKKGCDFLSSLCRVKAIPSDIVISTNGGYPLDQNIYQAVKGMTAAESTVKDGGVIIMISKSNDGIGGDNFYHQIADEKDIDKTIHLFLSRGRDETVPDQWQSQIFLRVLKKAKVIFISDAPDNIVENMHMIPSHSLSDALKKAEEILNNKNASVALIPDGVSVIVG